MAILSNINDKFAVDSTGAIQFNGQAGTSGYVLKSNGNAAPTWVDASTVIGGPYLPLSGGTLTGATATASGISFTVGGTLTGTTATFSGSVTIDSSTATLNIKGSNTGASLINFADSDDGNVGRIYYDHTDNFMQFKTNDSEKMRIESDGTVQITNSTSPKLQLKRGSKEYTTRVDNNNKFVIQEEGGNEFFVVESGASSNSIRIDNSGRVGIGTTNPTRNLTLGDGSGNSVLAIVAATNGLSQIGLGDTDDDNYGQIILRHSDGLLQIQNGGGAGITERGLNITSSEDIGIGTTTPTSKLDVFSGNGGATNTINVTHTRNDPDTAYNALLIDANYSGTKSATTDILQTGLKIDLDSSANGTANDEHRIYGAHIDVRNSGFADLVYGIYSYAESNYTGAKTAALAGLYGIATHDANSANGGVSNMYGVRGLAQIQDDGDVDSAYGLHGQVTISNNRDANVDSAYAIYGEVQIDEETPLTYSNLIGTRIVIDNNEGSTPTISNSFLFYGTYAGTRSANAWGIYAQGDKHYLEGNVGIGNTNPSNKLRIDATAGQATTLSNSITNAAVYINSDTANGSNNLRIGESGSGSYFLQVSNSAGTTPYAINLNPFGANVGIGTTSPSEKLEVNGSIKASSSAYVQVEADQTDSAAVRMGVSSQSLEGFFMCNNQGAGHISGNTSIKMLVYSTGGALIEPARFTVTGVGIGTTSPAQKLDVVGKMKISDDIILAQTNGRIDYDNGVSTGALRFWSTSGNSERMRITSAGNVGIGTANPTKKLTVFGTGAGNATVQIEGEGGADPYINFLANNAQHWSLGIDDSDSDKFKLSEHSALGTNDYLVVDTSGGVGIGETNLTGVNTILDLKKTGTNRGTNIRFKNDYNSNLYIGISGDSSGNALIYNQNNSDIVMYTGASGTEAMRIDSSGVVQVRNQTPTIQLYNTDTSVVAAQELGSIDFYTSDISAPRVSSFITSKFNSAFGDSYLSFGTSTGVGAATERMTIDSSGNVGIGTDSPNRQLSIYGTNDGYMSFDGGRTGNHEFVVGSDSAGFIIYDDTIDAYRFVIDQDSGNVGIGTTSPSSKLEVISGASHGTGFTQTRSGHPSFSLLSGGTNSVYLGIAPDSGSYSTFMQVVEDGTDINYIRFNTGASTERMRIDSSGTTMITKTQVTSSFDTTSFLRLHPSTTVNSGGFTNMFFGTSELDNFGISLGGLRAGTNGVPTFIIKTHNNDATGTERMRIDNSGHIYQGTVGEAANKYYYFQNSTTADAGLVFKDNASTNSGYLTYNHGLDAMKFGVNGSERMRIDSSGRVAIGLTNPSWQLEVSNTGTVRTAISSTNNGTAGVFFRVFNSGTQVGNGTIRTDNGGNMTFWTGTSGEAERMRIEADGDVVLTEGNFTMSGATPFIVLSNTAETESGITFVDSADPGQSAKITYDASSNKFNFYNNSSSVRMVIDSSGNILIGKTAYANANEGIVLRSAATSGGQIRLTRQDNTGTQTNVGFYVHSGSNIGTITTTSSSVAYNTSSDYRLKEDLQDFAGLDMVSKIPVYDFKWKSNESRSYGVMAHELQEVLPQAVSGKKDAEEMQGVDYSKIVPLLVKSIQELKAEIKLLKIQINN